MFWREGLASSDLFGILNFYRQKNNSKTSESRKTTSKNTWKPPGEIFSSKTRTTSKNEIRWRWEDLPDLVADPGKQSKKIITTREKRWV